MTPEDFRDHQDRSFDPSDVCLRDDESAKEVIDKAADIAQSFPEMSPKHVYGMALEYALTNKHQEHDNFVDFVHINYESV